MDVRGEMYVWDGGKGVGVVIVMVEVVVLGRGCVCERCFGEVWFGGVSNNCVVWCGVIVWWRGLGMKCSVMGRVCCMEVEWGCCCVWLWLVRCVCG